MKKDGKMEALDSKISGTSATITDLLPEDEQKKREQRYQLTSSLGKVDFILKDLKKLRAPTCGRRPGSDRILRRHRLPG